MSLDVMTAFEFSNVLVLYDVFRKMLLKNIFESIIKKFVTEELDINNENCG